MQNRRRGIAVLVVGIQTCLHGVAHADVSKKVSAARSGWTISRLLKTAFQNNPNIAATRKRWLATVRKSAGAGVLPDPMLMLADIFQEQSPLAVTQRKIQITQEVPWPAKRKLERRMAENATEIAILKYEKTVRETLTSVKQATAELWYAEEAVRLTKEHQGRLNSQAMTLSGPLAEEDVAVQELGLVWTSLARSRYDLHVLTRRRHLAQAKLNVLLGRSAGKFLALKNELSPAPEGIPDVASVNALEKLMAAHQQELKMADLSLKMARLKTEEARLAFKPDFSLGYGKSKMVGPSPGMGGRPFQNMTMQMDMFSFGVSLPIWRGKYRNGLAEAELNFESTSDSKKEHWNQSRFELRSVLDDLLSSAQLIGLYEKTLLPKAKELLEQSQTFFRVGVEPAASLLQAETVYFQYQLALVRARADYVKHLSAIEDLVGGPYFKLPLAGRSN